MEGFHQVMEIGGRLENEGKLTRSFMTPLSVLAAVLSLTPAQALDPDVLILNGRVIDPETRLDAIMNVGTWRTSKMGPPVVTREK